MSHSNYPTKIIHTREGDICAYCFNPYLTIDDDFDEHGNYGGTVYYCTCEQAILEQIMQGELESAENQRKEIERKYERRLKANETETLKLELKESFMEGLMRHMYIVNDSVSDEELTEVFSEALQVFREETFTGYDDND